MNSKRPSEVLQGSGVVIADMITDTTITGDTAEHVLLNTKVWKRGQGIHPAMEARPRRIRVTGTGNHTRYVKYGGQVVSIVSTTAGQCLTVCDIVFNDATHQFAIMTNISAAGQGGATQNMTVDSTDESKDLVVSVQLGTAGDSYQMKGIFVEKWY